MNYRLAQNAMTQQAHTDERHPRTPRNPRNPRIMACLPASRRAAEVAAAAGRLAEIMSADLEVLYVGDAGDRVATQMSELLRSAGIIRAKTTILSGDPVECVCAFAVENHVDLIVMEGPQEFTPLPELMANVAGRIAFEAPCSVLLLGPRTMRRQYAFDNKGMHNFVLSVGINELSRRMIHWLLPWFHAEGSPTVRVVHEYDAWGVHALLQPGQTGRYQPQARELANRAAQTFLEQFEWSGLDVQSVGLRMRNGCESLWYAEVMRADVLCVPMSLRHSRFWKRLVHHRLGATYVVPPYSLLIYRMGPTDQEKTSADQATGQTEMTEDLFAPVQD